MKTITNIIYTAIAVFALACFALLPRAEALTPAPDGGYLGANTAEGDNALLSLTTGAYNTAVGFASLRALTAGNLNTATGADTLLVNTASENTATGAGALLSNTTGHDNTANGALALLTNTEGIQNTATGVSALQSNTTGTENIAIGAEALRRNTTASNNNAIGFQSLQNNTTGGGNTGVGDKVLDSNTVGNNNTAVGAGALQNNTTGNQNTAIGTLALGQPIFSGGNVALGFQAGSNITTANNVICIGTNVAGNNVNDACYIGNIFGATSTNGLGVFINANGRLGTVTSSKRFKEEIKPMARVSEALFSLQPVTFRYKKEVDPEGDDKSQYGLVAEDVEKVNPDLVVLDKEGKPYSVRYDQVNAMLLNEFLKEHKKVEQQFREIQEQRATIAELRNEMGSVIAHLEEHDSKIQKVSEQIELSRSAPRMVLSNP